MTPIPPDTPLAAEVREFKHEVDAGRVNVSPGLREQLSIVLNDLICSVRSSGAETWEEFEAYTESLTAFDVEEAA